MKHVATDKSHRPRQDALHTPWTSVRSLLEQVIYVGNRCLTKPDDFGGVTPRTYWALLFMYARKGGFALVQQGGGEGLSEHTIKRLAAASFGAVRYVIHAGTTWTPALQCVTGFDLEQLAPSIRWLLKTFTPVPFRSWERK